MSQQSGPSKRISVKTHRMTLLSVVFIQAVMVTIIMSWMISALHEYEFIKRTMSTPNDPDFYLLFIGDYSYRIMNWCNIFIGIWYQLFFALDAHLHRNSLQVAVIPVVNALLLIIQAHDYALMTVVQKCFFDVEEALTNIVRLGGVVDFKTSIDPPEICAKSGLYGTSTNQPVMFFSEETLSDMQSKHQALLNAKYMCLANLMIVSLVLTIMCYPAFRTSREYSWRIYRIQGADIKQRNVLDRYHLFLLLLKLNIYFAMCDGMVYLFQVAVRWISDFSRLKVEFDDEMPDLKAGGYAPDYLMITSSFWCFLSALVFYFLGVRAIRKCIYWLMTLLLLVYIVQIAIEGRLCKYLIDKKAQNMVAASPNKYIYWALIVGVEMTFDAVIVVLGMLLLQDFGQGLAELVKDMEVYKPWIFKKKPKHLKVVKERFDID